MIVRGYIGLLFGASLAVAILSNDNSRRFIAEKVTPAPFIVLMVAGYVGSVFFRAEATFNIVIALGAALMIANIWFRRDTRTARFFAFGPLPWLGRLTYAIYLIQTLCIRVAITVLHHLPLPESPFVTFALSYALAIVGAWGLHVIIEKPLIGVGKRIVRSFQASATKAGDQPPFSDDSGLAKAG